VSGIETSSSGEIGYILRNISKAALLEQLAEECTELAQAALKLARIERDENPTPVTRDEAIEALWEEIADVNTCITFQLVDCDFKTEYVHKIVDTKKIHRWAERIREKKERDGDGG
jgi:NTP pyrophosphatase (non-canonical NTP hydrolase)